MTKMLKAIGFTHQLSAPHHQSGPLVSLYNLKLFSVSDTRKCFWDFGETVQKKKFDAFKGRWKDNNAISHLYCFSLCFCVRLPVA